MQTFIFGSDFSISFSVFRFLWFALIKMQLHVPRYWEATTSSLSKPSCRFEAGPFSSVGPSSTCGCPGAESASAATQRAPPSVVESGGRSACSRPVTLRTAGQREARVPPLPRRRRSRCGRWVACRGVTLPGGSSGSPLAMAVWGQF